MLHCTTQGSSFEGLQWKDKHKQEFKLKTETFIAIHIFTLFFLS